MYVKLSSNPTSTKSRLAHFWVVRIPLYSSKSLKIPTWGVSIFPIIEVKTENLKHLLIHLKIEIRPLLGNINTLLMNNNFFKTKISEKGVIV